MNERRCSTSATTCGSTPASAAARMMIASSTSENPRLVVTLAATSRICDPSGPEKQTTRQLMRRRYGSARTPSSDAARSGVMPAEGRAAEPPAPRRGSRCESRCVASVAAASAQPAALTGLPDDGQRGSAGGGARRDSARRREEPCRQLGVEAEIVAHPPRSAGRPNAVIRVRAAPVGAMLAHEAPEPEVVGVVDDGLGPIDEAAATMAPAVAELAILRRTRESARRIRRRQGSRSARRPCCSTRRSVRRPGRGCCRRRPRRRSPGSPTRRGCRAAR